ncbi:MAG: methanol oxidation system protein MoxJ [Methylotenera sp.]|jgi:mxaJ protein|uniref:Methanol oxidation system protein MoxJ n=1 Tax=Methylotenera mobilis TaxID=359408 RepID=A0A351RAY4_9PROT|nr:methanol oxidation system protein MoxJ [Methylotenera sp.]MDO9150880.1 methanol oxidation system protein MoxJ [Methylotenera sp.]MDP3776085.1 methanol oxidation system protein MoxJ [Methylotenera sp.]PPC90087.1 MAG: methanol oxidation system protein MoxJ [Methylotenera sp.]HBA09205.1 methanol oxidation system protein MoxJ [Methylotenera mobilis]
MKNKKFLRSGFKSLVLGVLSLWAVQVYADDLNVCAGKNEMPFSNDKKEGFENDIAEIIAKSLNKKLNYVYWDDPRYAVGFFLDKKKCDVVLGVDSTDPRVLKTKPYYKTGYVFITREDREIDISSWNDDLLKERNFRIGVMPDSPGKVMLLQINRFDDMFDYFAEKQKYQSTRNKYVRVDPQEVVNDVSNKYIHAAMLWAPEAARYVKQSKEPLKVQLVKDDAKKSNGESVQMHYEIVMGVRKDDVQLQQALNKAIDEKRSEIESVLKREGIPLLPI